MFRRMHEDQPMRSGASTAAAPVAPPRETLSACLGATKTQLNETSGLLDQLLVRMRGQRPEPGPDPKVGNDAPEPVLGDANHLVILATENLTKLQELSAAID